jgi:small nuclear ribonucleoprotein (snRNP)-like protein
LQNSYADIVTRRAWAELHNIMRPDCLVTVNTLKDSYEFDGPAAIGNFISGQLEQFSFFEFVVLNTVMEIDVDAGTAGARMYMQELRQGVSDGRRTNAYGVYHDRFERDAEGRWWFARRRYQSFARTAEPGSAGELDVFELPVLDLTDL